MMTHEKIISLTASVILLCLMVLSMSFAQEDDTTKGKLGYPLGTRMIIKGVRHALLMTAAFIPSEHGNSIRVDTVNGIKLEEPVSISLDDRGKTRNIHSKEFRYTFIGTEKGEWIGGNPGDQAGHQFYHTFMVDSVLYPTDLDIIKSDSTRN
jgi:hypothetical protein